MREIRAKIEAAIKREVRQRCGFGCVVCGKPFYEYDHINEYSKVKEHEADNLTLLCPDHHAEKTRGLRSADQVRDANAAPFNRRMGSSSPYRLAYGGTVSKVSIGSNSFVQTMGSISEPLVLNGEPLVRVRTESGNLLVSARLFDASGAVILTIDDNELKYDTGIWDVEFVSDRLIVREAHRKILAKIVFSPPDSITVERAHFSHEGLSVQVTAREILYRTKRGKLSISGNSVLDIPYPRGVVLTDENHELGSLPAAINVPVRVG
ncbi:HNH endonuclease signature motif containing protein [Streptomyces qaidamensis]|uniref:HNH endonuclease signature motif containing protein n=1 Tax=Streptomyces qaidamensis TaxID=1783515 RepID=UPI000B0F8AE0|nr:HNH endonuclease signature motif containing protein [Streptomyces qaidamensis]